MNFFRDNLFPLIKLAIPLALTGLLQSGVFFFETIFLAHLGATTLAAGALVSWLFGTLVVVMLGILSSVNILISHHYGANEHHNISLVVRNGLWLGLLLIPPTFLLFWNMDYFFIWIGQGPALVELVKSYLHALAWGILPDFILIVLLEFIVGLGHAHVILKLSILEVLLSVSFSFCLIFGKFGLPALGIAGAGWGITISYWLTLIVLLVYLYLNKIYHRYFSHFLVFTKPCYIWELLRIGFPMGIMYCVEVGFFFILTLLMGFFGTQILAANQIAMQYMGLLMSVIFSVAQAITVRMGYLLGAKENAAAEKAAYAGVLLSFALMVIIALGFWFYPEFLIAIDFDTSNVHNAEIVQFATALLMVSALFQIVEAMRISFFGALRSLRDTHFTLFISLFSFWIIALPLGYFLAIYCHFGGTGLWWGMVIGTTMSVLLLFWRFKIKIHDYVTL